MLQQLRKRTLKARTRECSSSLRLCGLSLNSPKGKGQCGRLKNLS